MGPKDEAINHIAYLVSVFIPTPMVYFQGGNDEKYEVKQKFGTSLPNLALSLCSVLYVTWYIH